MKENNRYITNSYLGTLSMNADIQPPNAHHVVGEGIVDVVIPHGAHVLIYCEGLHMMKDSVGVGSLARNVNAIESRSRFIGSKGSVPSTNVPRSDNEDCFS